MVSRALIAAGLVALSLGLASCFGGDDSPPPPAAKVGVLLPDGPRWRSRDRSALARAFRKEGVPVAIAFAPPGPRARREATRLLDSGVRVLVVGNADAASGAPVEALAHARRVPVVAYERLSAGGAADYLVSYDFVQAGRLMGDGLVECLRDADVKKPRLAELNGPATDDEATKLKQGYDAVLNPRYSAKLAVKVSDRSLPAGGSRADARRLVGEMLAAGHNRLDGIVAASDGLAGAAIDEVRARGLPPIAVVGQAGTPEGRRNLRAGAQCMTVPPPVIKQAKAAARVAGALARGQKPPKGLMEDTVTQGTRKIPTVLVEPEDLTAKDLENPDSQQ
jgi:D-xylose transport system substrate-binding protein